MKIFIIKSFVSMLISWVIACIVVLISEGAGDGISGISGFFLMGLIVISIAWVIFIFPLIKVFKRIMENEKLKLVFPIITALYGFIVFVLIFSGFTGFTVFADFFTAPTLLSVTAAGVGLLWGLIFVLITQNTQGKEVESL